MLNTPSTPLYAFRKYGNRGGVNPKPVYLFLLKGIRVFIRVCWGHYSVTDDKNKGSNIRVYYSGLGLTK